MTIPRLSLGSFDRVLRQVGATLELQAFVQRLLKIGYNRVMKVMEHGEFSVKGSLIDIYPMGAKK
jgi:transcription-repair coupling factor (superfamily II helicase)